MSDIKIDLDPLSDTSNDIPVVNGDLVIVTGREAMLQHILQRLRMYFSEWFMDNTIGLPFFTEILVKNPDQAKIDALFINQILGTPGVLQLTTYSFIPNFQTRGLAITFEAKTTQGTVNYAGLI